MSFLRLAKQLGRIQAYLGLLMATSLIWSFIYHETSTIIAFLLALIITEACSLGAYWLGRKESNDLTRREALAVVGSTWIFAGIFGALPFVINGYLNFPSAFFEIVSGFTTTGSSVLADIEALPFGLLWWRSFTHWLGGMGIVVLFIAILPHLGTGGKFLFKFESPGPITEKLRPRLKHTAATYWIIYCFFTGIEVILLYYAGMNLFDSFTHTFGSLATGGYSTKNLSVGAYNSISIEIIIISFMLLGGINFALYYAFIKGDWKIFRKDAEFKTFIGIYASITLISALFLLKIYPNFFTALRYSSFQVASLLTNTGFANDNFDLWPQFNRILLVILPFIGGCAGSTCGGLKIIRVMVLVKAALRSVYQVFRPRSVKAIHIGKQPISEEIVQGIMMFFFLAVIIWVLASVLLTAMGVEVVTAVTATSATLWNAGPGLAGVGPTANYSCIPSLGLILLSLVMIIGRLEVFAILVMFYPAFWRK